jgi:hypothetical protein
MGWGDSAQRTMRPSFVREMSPASSSTRRCFMKPVSDMPCGSASSVTLRLRSPRVSSTVRRVASESAAKTASRVPESGDALE